jgi:branched-chain amino acid transport system ATP-binding protein
MNREEQVAILLAEQNAAMALRVVQYGYVMENGRIVLDGEAKVLRRTRMSKSFTWASRVSDSAAAIAT